MVIAENRVRKDARTPLAIRHCVSLSVLLVVATMRGLAAPLPDGCDGLLDRYGAECYLPRFYMYEDGEVIFMPGKLSPACAELHAALDVRCVRWRGAKIGKLYRVWWAERAAERAREDDAERARWATIPACPRQSFRRRGGDPDCS